jgi:hypothetical protein
MANQDNVNINDHTSFLNAEDFRINTLSKNFTGTWQPG